MRIYYIVFLFINITINMSQSLPLSEDPGKTNFPTTNKPNSLHPLLIHNNKPTNITHTLVIKFFLFVVFQLIPITRQQVMSSISYAFQDI